MKPTIEQIKYAIKERLIVDFTFGGWGILTALSDDETTVYYEKNGCSLFRLSTTVDKVIINETTSTFQ